MEWKEERERGGGEGASCRKRLDPLNALQFPTFISQEKRSFIEAGETLPGVFVAMRVITLQL